MSLADLLYRCPFCGADTEGGTSAEVRCPACRRVYDSGVTGSGLRVRDPHGSDSNAGIGALVDRLGSLEPDDSILESSAVARFALGERPVRYRSALIGFYEEQGDDRPGRLLLDGEALRFDEPSGETHRWALLDLRAVQTASAAVQIFPLGGVLVSFRLLDDSPRRWEEVLKARVRSVWRAEGRGEILEFQPRIRTK